MLSKLKFRVEIVCCYFKIYTIVVYDNTLLEL